MPQSSPATRPRRTATPHAQPVVTTFTALTPAPPVLVPRRLPTSAHYVLVIPALHKVRRMQERVEMTTLAGLSYRVRMARVKTVKIADASPVLPQ